MNDKLIWKSITDKIKIWGHEFGFDEIGISDINLSHSKKSYDDWIKSGFQGKMHYLKKHQDMKFNPQNLVPETLTVISARLNYFPKKENTLQILQDKNKAYISRYTLGRDYHKVIRGKLKKLTKKLKEEVKNISFNSRVFTDTAPVLEVELAEKAGLGWRGKHSLLLNKDNGSWFFLGEIYTSLPLVVDEKKLNHCGTCSACIDVCPTNAIIAPYKLDASKCISYLTIEFKGSIPTKYRKPIGNRIYGCDDCQLVCPWNKYGKITKEKDFNTRHNLDNLSLIDSFKITEAEFTKIFNGSAILRIGYDQWLRNVAVGLGNAPKSNKIIKVLESRLKNTSKLVQEHILWAINEHQN
ncbi:tRNA epoxyqueuosine(34) reductase QueG [Nitrosomonadales bacterium]|nr:tRNA epoxyqueuosine(34) reductase QueG [Nitrosomonadales bacterium]